MRRPSRLRLPLSTGRLIGIATVLSAVPIFWLGGRFVRDLAVYPDLWPWLQSAAKGSSGWVMHTVGGLLGAVVTRRDAGVGQSLPMRTLRDIVERVADTDATVIITGETGVGKELVARAIHELSPRKGRPFVKVNCAAIPGELFESEFFGHERGAFTQAVERSAGRIEQAHGGTLFLDEVGDLVLDMQAKLLHVLEDGEFYRVGAVKPLRADVRIVAATNADLAATVAAGRFREDLYYRLNVVPIHVPPLRQRREDVPALIDYFCATVAREYGRPVQLSAATREQLLGYDWPGNVRELQTLIQRVGVLGEERGCRELLARLAAPASAPVAVLVPEPQVPATLKEIADEAAANAERAAILEVLREVRWHRGKAARLLSVSRRVLAGKLARLGMIERGEGPVDGTPAA